MPRIDFEPAPPPAKDAPPRSPGRKLMWFVALAVGGGVSTAAVAYMLRGLLMLG